MKVAFESLMMILLLFEIYAMVCVYSKVCLENRYSKKHEDFRFYVLFPLIFPIFLCYPIQILLRKRSDIKYKRLYLTERIKNKGWIMQPDEDLTEMKKQLNKLERRIKLKKI